MRVTIQDIANAANVAKSTVSKVMSDSPRISEATKQRIRAIMREMNYTPSSLATQLARQSSFNIGMLVDMAQREDFLNAFFYNIIGGVESVIGPLSYELTISNVQYHQNGPSYMERLVRSRRVDGLIASSELLTADNTAEMMDLEFPLVSIGENGSTVHWVDYDNRRGGYMLTEHLLQRGCSSVAFIGGHVGGSLYDKRFRGYRDALSAAGIGFSPDWVLEGTADEHGGYDMAIRLLSEGSRTDGVVCMSNYAAAGLLRAADKLGVRVPHDLLVTAFDDYPLSAFTSPPLTCLHIDTFELGIEAGKLLMQRLSDPSLPRQSRLIEPRLIVRESTG
ncbi:LacI family DNA-binding transcriptional regulator [Paenibacillus sp. D51F]